MLGVDDQLWNVESPKLMGNNEPILFEAEPNGALVRRIVLGHLISNTKSLSRETKLFSILFATS